MHPVGTMTLAKRVLNEPFSDDVSTENNEIDGEEPEDLWCEVYQNRVTKC